MCFLIINPSNFASDSFYVLLSVIRYSGADG